MVWKLELAFKLATYPALAGPASPRAWFFVPVLAALGLVACLEWRDAHAKFLYSCRDASNRLITSDRPIPECAERTVRELSRKDGRVLREIAAPLTAAQRQEKAAEEARRAATEKLAEEERRRDRALLSIYADVQALEAARKRRLAEPQAQVKAILARLAELEAERAAQLQESLPFKGKALPVVLEHNIRNTEGAIERERRQLDDRSAIVTQINERYDADSRRFQMLMNRSRSGR